MLYQMHRLCSIIVNYEQGRMWKETLYLKVPAHPWSWYSYCMKNIVLFVIGAGIAQWYSAGLRAGWLGVWNPVGFGNFLFTTASIAVLVPTQPPIQWISGALSLEVKRPGREADHSPPSSADITNVWSYTSTHPVRLHGAVLSWSAGTTLPHFYLISLLFW
jgi:hypothetical protein